MNRLKPLLGIFFSALATLLILKVHIIDGRKSMIALNKTQDSNSLFDPYYLNEVVSFHKTQVDFAKRPLTTFFIEQSSKLLGISISDAFVLINFSLLFLCGIVIYSLIRRIGHDHWKGLFACFFFYSSYSVLFSFYPPVYTYDEPAQYFFLLLGLSLYFERRYIPMAFCILLSLVARETSCIFWMALYLYHYRKHGFNLIQSLYVVIPFLMYLVFLLLYLKPDYLTELMQATQNRGRAIADNFGSQAVSVESILVFVNTCLCTTMFVLILYGQSSLSRQERWWIESYLGFLLVNTFIVLCFTLAREARLFYLPVLFCVPVTPLILEEIRRIWTKRNIRKSLNYLSFYVTVILALLFSLLISYRVFSTTIGIPKDNYFREYSFVLLAFVSMHLLIRYHIRLKA